MIAVGLNDQVAILTPKISLDSLSRGEVRPTDAWDECRVQTCLYTEFEAPILDPLPWKIQSIGEEQSGNRIVSMAWSPPGLAKNMRCALAVLTSNHILSLWCSDSDPSNSQSWARTLVVNHALKQDHRDRPGQFQDNALREDAKLLKASRIRSFSWASPLQCIESVRSSDGEIIKVPVQRQLLVVSTELKIAIAEISSPNRSFMTRTMPWSARVVTRLKVSSAPPRSPPLGDIQCKDLLNDIAKNLTWSHFMYSHGDETLTHGSAIAYTLGRKLFLVPCVIQVSDKDLALEFNINRQEKLEGDHQGLVSFLKQV